MDIMHDFLEGGLQYEVKELLKHLISTRLLSLQEVNAAIESFSYGYSDVTDKPSPISSTTLSSTDHSLKQSGKYSNSYIGLYLEFTHAYYGIYYLASQMWCLARLLPLMIGGKIPETNLIGRTSYSFSL